MPQAPMFECLAFDAGTAAQDVGGAAEVGVGGRHILQALVIAGVVVVLDEALQDRHGIVVRYDGVTIYVPVLLIEGRSKMVGDHRQQRHHVWSRELVLIAIFGLRQLRFPLSV